MAEADAALELDFLTAGCRLLAEQYDLANPDNQRKVLGFGYGLIARDGRWTDELGLVLLAQRGGPGFPYQTLSVTVDSTTRAVPCCVFLLDGFAYQAVPAAPVVGTPPLSLGAPLSTTPGFAEGTWACFTGQPAQLAFTAAHVFANAQEGSTVYCGSRPVGQVSFGGSSDLAVIQLSASAAAEVRSVTPDGVPVGGPTKMSWRSIDRQGYVYCPTRARTERPRILAAGMTLHLLQVAGQRITQQGAIMTEACTQPGDSGTGLVTEDGYVVGVLSHGRKEFSFFQGF